MDLYFHEKMDMGVIWPEAILELLEVPVNVAQSAFTPYRGDIVGSPSEVSIKVSPSSGSMNKRMIEFLRRMKSIKGGDGKAFGGRCYRHMIVERQRREKMRQSYIELHSLLPSGSKADKNSIVQVAANHLQRMQGMKAELQRQNEELRKRLEEKERDMSKVKIRVAHPSSPLDSMIEVLECLKRKNLKAKVIRSEFSNQEFSAMFEIESKTPVTEIEKAVDTTLKEVERKFSTHFQEAIC